MAYTRAGWRSNSGDLPSIQIYSVTESDSGRGTTVAGPLFPPWHRSFPLRHSHEKKPNRVLPARCAMSERRSLLPLGELVVTRYLGRVRCPSRDNYPESGSQRETSLGSPGSPGRATSVLVLVSSSHHLVITGGGLRVLNTISQSVPSRRSRECSTPVFVPHATRRPPRGGRCLGGKTRRIVGPRYDRKLVWK